MIIWEYKSLMVISWWLLNDIHSRDTTVFESYDLMLDCRYALRKSLALALLHSMAGDCSNIPVVLSHSEARSLQSVWIFCTVGTQFEAKNMFFSSPIWMVIIYMLLIGQYLSLCSWCPDPCRACAQPHSAASGRAPREIRGCVKGFIWNT